MKKKLLSIILALTFCFSFIVTTFAATPIPFTNSDETASITLLNIVREITVPVATSFDYSTGDYFPPEQLSLYYIQISDDSLLYTTLLNNITFTGPEGHTFSFRFYTKGENNIYYHEFALDGPEIIVGSGGVLLGGNYVNVLQLSEDSTGTFQALGINMGDRVVLISFTSDAPTVALPPVNAPSSWAEPEVTAAIAAGLVPEELQRDYQSSISRGSVAQMFINLIEKASGMSIDDFMAEKGVTVNESAFTDTTDRAVLAANALGIIQGVGDNRFDPDGIFKRAHVAVIINRVARVLGVDTDGYAHLFTDVQGHWADPELGWPVHAGIIEGVGNNRFDPEGNLTTEMVIMITYRALVALS